MTISKTANPMSEGKMNAQLAKELATLPSYNIEKIRVQFKDIDEYIPEDNTSVPML